MSRQAKIRTLVVGLAAIALAVLLILNAQPDNRLVNNFESVNAFSFQYPNGWQYVIPQYNVLLLGKPQTLINNQPGPTMTVQRSLTLISEGSLNNAFNTYLQQGPLSPEKAWTKFSEIIPTTLNNLPALKIDLQGNEHPTWPEMHSHITAVGAHNGNVYLITLSSPVDDWESDRLVLESILNSIKITE